MKTIALTGGIASGKSTVAKFFNELGATIIDADLEAHKTYERGTQLYQEIIQRYGSQIVNQQGHIDRQQLANILFNDAKEKSWLENKIHPLTRQRIKTKIDEAKTKKTPLIIVEAALHVESGYYQDFEGLIVVDLDSQTQINRIKTRDHLNDTQIQDRLRNQMPIHKKKKYANWMIDNSRSLKETQQQVSQLFNQLKN